MHALRIYKKSLRMNIISGLEYKGWWLMVINVVFNVVTDPLSTVLLFSRFGSIGAWSMERIVLIYALAVTAFGLAETFCRGFDYFPQHSIRTGQFDRMLLRPAPLFVQIAGSYFHIHRLARVACGFAVSVWAMWQLGATLNWYNGLMLGCALLGGCFIYSGVFVITSGIALYTVKALDWIYIFTNASYQVTRCPVEYMPRLLKNAFIFFMPILLISYYPAAVICGWGEPVWTGWLSFPVSALFMAVSWMIWKIGMRHYQSTGS